MNKKKETTIEEEIEKLCEEVEKKRKNLKPKLENPITKEYHAKLKELLDSKYNSRDNFMNWVTGLTTGAALFVFANVSSVVNNKILFRWSGVILFSAIISAMLFKILLEVRYSSQELDLELLKNFYKGYDTREQIKKMVEAEGRVTNEYKLKLLKIQMKNFNFLDEAFLEKRARPITIKSRLLNYFYYSTLTLFLIGVSLMAGYFVLQS